MMKMVSQGGLKRWRKEIKLMSNYMTYMYICGMARKDGTKAMFILQNKHCQDYPWTYRAFQNLPVPSVKFSWSLELDALDEAETEKLAKALKLVSLADLWVVEPVEV